jgi:peptidoglycan/xylan/chitin deacetylase (PgdA/CDA1 family)
MTTTRRRFLAACAAGAVTRARPAGKARMALTLDLEMSAEYPRRGMTEWNYRKGDLDGDTKRYAVEAARVARAHGGLIHFFAVGRVLEQPDIDWLKTLAADGHPIGNHTYDHVNVKATRPEDVQFRFRRAPWLLRGRPAADVIEENIAVTTRALKERCGIVARGFRTPGGFPDGLKDRPDVQATLRRLGFSWVSSLYPSHRLGPPGTRPDDAVLSDLLRAQAEAQPFAYASGLVEVPMSPISDVAAFRAGRWELDWFLDATRRLVEQAIRTGTTLDFLGHPSCLVVEDPTFRIVRLICDLVREAGDRAEMTDLDAIAAMVPAGSSRRES